VWFVKAGLERNDSALVEYKKDIPKYTH